MPGLGTTECEDCSGLGLAGLNNCEACDGTGRQAKTATVLKTPEQDRRLLLNIRKQIHDRMFAAREAYEDELSMNCSNPLSDSLKEEADWLLVQLDELDAHLGLTELPDRLKNPNQKQPT